MKIDEFRAIIANIDGGLEGDNFTLQFNLEGGFMFCGVWEWLGSIHHTIIVRDEDDGSAAYVPVEKIVAIVIYQKGK